MAFTPNRIHVGPARIFVGVTAPASGAPPTFVGHTAGVPATGTEIGLTNADTTFTYEAKKAEIQAEQFYAGVDVYLQQESAKVTFTAEESTVKALQTAFDNIGQFTDGTKEAFYGGSGSGAFTTFTQVVMLTSRQRINTSKYIVIMLYKAYPSKGLIYPFSRTKPAMWPAEFTGLADPSRTAGDAMFQFYYEL
jgi:hypothetical protein